MVSTVPMARVDRHSNTRTHRGILTKERGQVERMVDRGFIFPGGVRVSKYLTCWFFPILALYNSILIISSILYCSMWKMYNNVLNLAFYAVTLILFLLPIFPDLTTLPLLALSTSLTSPRLGLASSP